MGTSLVLFHNKIEEETSPDRNFCTKVTEIRLIVVDVFLKAADVNLVVVPEVMAGMYLISRIHPRM